MTTYKEPKFYTTSGKLTAYALACGYVETLPDNWKIFKDGCYHLRRSNSEWLTFATLADAWAEYRRIVKGATNG